jgi:hypothetical protein
MLIDSFKELATGKNAKTIFYPTSMKDAPFMWNPEKLGETVPNKEKPEKLGETVPDKDIFER